MPAHIAVILCTRNRAFRLGPTLDALARAIASAPGCEVEVMLIDSASSDATLSALSIWAASQPGRIEVLKCDRPGVCLAKNLGIRASVAPLIVMTDDDCLVDPDFIVNIAKSFSDVAIPLIKGGRITLGDPQDLPITIKPDDALEVFQGKRMPTGFLMGANMVVTRKVFEAIGLFDELFGPGARMQAAEDTEFLARAMLANIPISYDPSFSVAHFHGRKTIVEGRDLCATYSFGDGAVWGKYLLQHPFVLRSMVFCLRAVFREMIRPSKDAVLGRHKAWWRLRRQVAGLRSYMSIHPGTAVPRLPNHGPGDALRPAKAA